MIKKSNPDQLTSRVNCIAIKGISKTTEVIINTGNILIDFIGRKIERFVLYKDNLIYLHIDNTSLIISG